MEAESPDSDRVCLLTTDCSRHYQQQRLGMRLARPLECSPGMHGVHTSAPLTTRGTYDVLAVFGKGGFHKHGAQGKAQIVFRVTHAKLPAGQAGLENTRVGVSGLNSSSRPLPSGKRCHQGPVLPSGASERDTFFDPVGASQGTEPGRHRPRGIAQRWSAHPSTERNHVFLEPEPTDTAAAGPTSP